VGGRGRHAAFRENHRPTQVVSRLATQHGGEVPKLTVTRPSLEDTYLALIAPHLEATPEDHPEQTLMEVVS